MTRDRIVVVTTIVCGFLLSSCTTHIAPYRPKRRHFAPGKIAATPATQGSSLFVEGGGLFEDVIATRIGDMLVVRIDERDSGSRDASTKLGKKSSSSRGATAAFGLIAALKAKYPNMDPAALFSVESDTKFNGTGKITRKGRLSATLPVRVKQVLSNGDLYIEGTKVVMVGNEEHHIYLSGIVRRYDIDSDNSVASSRVADAEIEYTARGDVNDQQRPGWFSRVVSTLWPF